MQSAVRRHIGRPPKFWHTNYLVHHNLYHHLQTRCFYLSGRVLDLGCGNRPYQPMLVNASEYVAYDIDHAGSLPEIVGTAQCLPFQEATFDGVLSTQVIEHVSDPWLMLEEISRILRSGGLLVLSAPQAWRLHEVPHDYYRYTPYGLRHLIERAGMSVLEIVNQGGVWAQIGQTLNNTLWQKRLVKRFSTGWFLRRLITVGINASCLWLDQAWYDAHDTLNYVVLAQKNVRPVKIQHEGSMITSE